MNIIYINFYISAIAIDHDSSFKTDQDILVLPLDVVKYDTHEKLTQDVLKHFGKVHSIDMYFLINVKAVENFRLSSKLILPVTLILQIKAIIMFWKERAQRLILC